MSAIYQVCSPPQGAPARGLLLPVLAGALCGLPPLVVLGYLLANPELDPLIFAPLGHFYLVGVIALAAAVLSAVVARAAARLQDVRATLMAGGYLSLAGLFLVHALTTPGVLIDLNPWVGLSSKLGLWMVAACLAASSLSLGRHVAERFHRLLQPLLLVLVAVLAVYALVALRLPLVPLAEELAAAANRSQSLNLAGSSLSLGLIGLALVRYWHGYRLTRSGSHAATLLGLVFLAEAQLSIFLSELWRASWWEYHVLLMASFGVMMSPILVGWLRGGSLTAAVERLFVRELVAQVEHGHSEATRALVAALEARDAYTRGHSHRVARLAVRLGEAMGLPPERLRVLSQAGLLHDIGKLGVADAVLNKPGPLKGQEVEHIRQHPALGAQMLAGFPSLHEEMRVIRHHHERVDGRGYPDRLRGAAIPLEARIIAVVDVYDALTSARSYRPAWTEARALDYLRAQAGTHLDPYCVDAFLRLLHQAGPPAYPLLAAER